MPVIFHNSSEPAFVGATLALGEMNGYHDSDFYAVVYDAAEDTVRRVEYDTTRFAGGGSAYVDATEETQLKAAAVIERRLFNSWLAQNTERAKSPDVGKRVRIVKGRPTLKHEDGSRTPVAKGTEGVVIYAKERRSQYGTWSYGLRLGIAISDEREPSPVHVVVDGDVVRVRSPYNEALIAKLRARGGRWDKTEREWVLDAKYADYLLEIRDEVAPGRYTQVVWTNATNVEVVDHEQYLPSEETGRSYARRNSRNWRGATSVAGWPCI